jgi:tRNA-dihydrouridine synthase B
MQHDASQNNEKSLIHELVVSDSLLLEGNIFLAPMAGFTDAPFRALCIEYGAFFTYTEMVSSQAVSRRNTKTLKLLEPARNERQYGIQIFASDPEIARRSVKEIEAYRPAIIDLNCGCSIPKILRAGCGASLLAAPAKIGEIISAMKDSTDIPITCKIRSGIDSSSINYLEIAEIAEKAGASLITLHPRTKAEVFRGKAKWEHIKELKASVSIPVIGSGDLFHPLDVKTMLFETGCDGVMIARGAIGNPFIFRRTIDLLTSGEIKEIFDAEEKFEAALNHLGYMIESKGEKRGCMEMRKHFCAYTKGLPDSSVIRNSIVKAVTFSDYRSIADEYLGSHRAVQPISSDSDPLSPDALGRI